MMKRLLLGVAAPMLMSSAMAEAQLAAPNARGLAFNHIHLSVADVELHKSLWSDLLDGEVVERSGYVAIAVPGALIFLTDRPPTGPSLGTAVNHVGFKVRDLDGTLSRWRSLGYDVDAESVGAEGLPQAYVTMPNGTRVELTGDPDLQRSSQMHDVRLVSSNPGEHLAWWLDVLGSTPRTRGTVETTTDVPGVNLSFARADGVTPTQGTAVDHIGFEVEDIRAFSDSLRSKGVVFQIEPFHVESLDIWVGFFMDPAGARVEVSQGLDRFQPSGPAGDGF